MYRNPPSYQQANWDLQSWLSSVSTLNTLNTMSSKGYSAVPTNEPRESVDMEASVQHEPYQDDASDTTAADRLLPDDSSNEERDNAREPSKRASYPKRVGRWLRSRPRYYYDSA